MTPEHSIKANNQQPKTNAHLFLVAAGFPLVQILPKGHRFNAEYFCNPILHEIDQIRPATTDEDA
jgi:hypothetical protein